jgi:peptidyl-prolyl cis-trans isomerase SurA
MFRIVLALVIIVFCGQGFAQSTQSAKPQVLFTLKNQKVSADEFIYIYKKNHPAKEDYTGKKIDEYLNLFINFKLKVTEAQQRGIDTTSAFIREYNSYKDELRRPYLPEGKILDSLVKITYSRLQEEVKASHILIGIKPDATPADTAEAYSKIIHLKMRAQQGEDFATLAGQFSEDPSARSNKGDLGYFTALQMVFPFENAAYSGKKGDVVGPVRTRFGYHIIKVEDRKPARGEVEVSHIMIRTGERQDDEARNLIFDIHDQLRTGMNWDELVKKFSEDPGTKNTNGRLRPFGVGAMNAAPEFDRAAFSLNKAGEISDPFQTQYGWHIVRLEQKIPLPSFDNSYASLKGRVGRDERVQVSRQALMTKLKKDFQFQENEAVKAKVFALADSTLSKGDWKPTVKSIERENLFTLTNIKITVLDFLNYVRRNQKAAVLAPEKHLEQLYTTFVEQQINDQLERQIIQKNPDFKILLTEYFEGILLFDVMEREVWKKASEDSIGQLKYFEANTKKYLAGERVRAEIYSANSKELIMALSSNIEKNDTAAIKKALTGKTIRQENGVFQKTDRPALSKINWATGNYVVEANGIHYYIIVIEIVPPGSMSFSEARANVITDYQDSLEQSWIATLKKKYPVKINTKVKAYVVQKLTQ